MVTVSRVSKIGQLNGRFSNVSQNICLYGTPACIYVPHKEGNYMQGSPFSNAVNQNQQGGSRSPGPGPNMLTIMPTLNPIEWLDAIAVFSYEVLEYQS